MSQSTLTDEKRGDECAENTSKAIGYLNVYRDDAGDLVTGSSDLCATAEEASDFEASEFAKHIGVFALVPAALAHPTPRTVSQETFERVREALAELIECAELRGDNVLPNPCDDPKTWTSRMQNAWDDAESALNETAELASDGASQPQIGETL